MWRLPRCRSCIGPTPPTFLAELYIEMHETINNNFLMDDCDEPMPEWLNIVNDVVDSEDPLPNNIKENLGNKCQNMYAKDANNKDDYNNFHEQFGKSSKMNAHEMSTNMCNNS
eukprot:14777664-Heterocapsa_arctica.AAC.1